MEWNRNAAAMATGPNPYAVFGDAPLIDETDVGSMFFVWNEYANLVATYAGSYMNVGFSFPAMYDLEVREEIPVSTYFFQNSVAGLICRRNTVHWKTVRITYPESFLR